MTDNKKIGRLSLNRPKAGSGDTQKVVPEPSKIVNKTAKSTDNKDTSEPADNTTMHEKGVKPESVDKSGPQSTSGKASSTTKPSADKKELDTLGAVLEAVFTPHFTKDGKPKASSFTQNHQHAFKRLESGEDLYNETMNRCAELVGQSDPEFSKLLQLALLTQKVGSNLKQKTLEFCVKAVSQNWIGKHRGDDNVFVAQAGGISLDNPGFLAHMSKRFTDEYVERIDKLKARIKERGEVEDEPESSVRSLKPEQMRNQCENLLAIGYIWAAETGKCEPEKAIAELEKRHISHVKEIVNKQSVYYYLAEQLPDSRQGAADTICHYNKRLTESREQYQSAENARQTVQNQLDRAKKENADLFQENAECHQQIAQLKAELEKAKLNAQEQELDAKADRVHLKDDASKAKSRAFNLLTEDVAGPLKLSLKALQRETPKVAVAEHQIELAIENIERELEWFKK